MARKSRQKKPVVIDAERVLAMVSELQPAKSADVAKRMGADQLLLRNELMALERLGKVHRTGQTRGTRWYVGPGSGARPATDEALPPEAGAPAAAPKARRGPKEQKLDDFRDQLGKVPDADIAKQAGVSQRTVQNYRKRHKIMGFGVEAAATVRPVKVEKAARAEPAPKAEKSPRVAKADAKTAAGGFVWRVEWRAKAGTESGYVVAASVVEAGAAAAARVSGEVVGLALVGRLV